MRLSAPLRNSVVGWKNLQKWNGRRQSPQRGVKTGTGDHERLARAGASSVGSAYPPGNRDGHELLPPRQPFGCCASPRSGDETISAIARPVAFSLLLDVRGGPDLDRLAGRSLRCSVDLHDCRVDLVTCDVFYGHYQLVRGDAAAAAAAGAWGGGRISGVLPCDYFGLSRDTPGLGELGHRYGLPLRTRARYLVRWADGGQHWLAMAFSANWWRGSGLADSLDVYRSTQTGARGARGRGGNRLDGPAPPACLVGHLLRTIRSKLCVVLPVDLAAILSRQGAPFLAERDGGMGSRPIFSDGGYIDGRRDSGGPPDCARCIGRPGPPGVCLHGVAVDCVSAAVGADSSH